MFSSIEKKWLDYAWRVISDDSHIHTCASNGGGGIDHPTLRWPGYLGENYEEGGLVFIANIHRDFNSGRAANTTLAQELVECSLRWLENGRSEESDRAYLDETRRCYQFGLERWNIGARFGEYLDLVGLDWRDIVYTNAARCQSLKGPEPRLQRICQAYAPFSDLERFLQPCQILTVSKLIRDEINIQSPRHWFNSRNGIDDRGNRFNEWAPKAAEEFQFYQLQKQEKNTLREEASNPSEDPLDQLSGVELRQDLARMERIDELNRRDLAEIKELMEELRLLLEKQQDISNKIKEIRERINTRNEAGPTDTLD